MALDDIPLVTIDHEGDFRFIQMRGPEGRNYVYVRDGVNSHTNLVRSHFFQSLRESVVELSYFKCVGGGKILIKRDRSLVIAYDSSHVYGDFDSDIVRDLLETYVAENDEFRGFSVEI